MSRRDGEKVEGKQASTQGEAAAAKGDETFLGTLGRKSSDSSLRSRLDGLERPKTAKGKRGHGRQHSVSDMSMFAAASKDDSKQKAANASSNGRPPSPAAKA